jgi:hypothetical protein
VIWTPPRKTISSTTAAHEAASADANINRLIVMQVALGAAGLLVFVLVAWGLIALTHRQAAHLSLDLFQRCDSDFNRADIVLSPPTSERRNGCARPGGRRKA